VELSGAAFVDDVAAPSVSNVVVDGLYYDAAGDRDLFRDQGYTLVQGNRVSDSSGFGILVDNGPRTVGDSLPHPGAVRNLREVNTQRLVPGILLENNLLVENAAGGIRFSGDDTANAPLAAVPFGRIVNNTIFGGSTATGIGIEVGQNAGPTIMNNVVTNSATGIQVDASSLATTVLGANVYQGNTLNRTAGVADLRNIALQPTDPLFVDPATGNFYLRQGSQAIDSSLNSLQERPALQTVTDPLGIPVSPILAPDIDLFGQLRVDDPLVTPPPGLGSNVFKDRGAIDRADFIGPSATLLNPADNDSGGVDEDPDLNEVRVTGQTVTHFSIQFADGTGIGLADTTIVLGAFTLTRDGVPLAEITDFLFSYDATNNVARFDAAAGLFLEGTYQFTVSNTITDLANNPLRPNQTDGTIQFTVVLAPAPLNPWQNADNPLDVDANTFVVPLDALIIINYLNANGAGPLPLPATPPPFYDVNGDTILAPLDALIIINFLNSQPVAAPLLAPLADAAELGEGAVELAEPLLAARREAEPAPAAPGLPRAAEPAVEAALAEPDWQPAAAELEAAWKQLAAAEEEGLAAELLGQFEWEELVI
jgi:hypothetical protein